MTDAFREEAIREFNYLKSRTDFPLADRNRWIALAELASLPAAQGGEAGRGVDVLQGVLTGLPRYGMTTEWYERQEAVKPEGSAFLYSETETRHHSRRVIGRVPNGEYVSLAELTAALAPQRSENGNG